MNSASATAAVAAPATESTALVPRAEPLPPTIAAYLPRDIQQAQALANFFAAGGLFPALENAPQIFTVMAIGAELDLPPTTALREIYIVKGRPYLSAALKIGLCLRKPDVCEYFQLVETSATQATYVTKRRGQEPVRYSFTIEEARAAQKNGRFEDDSNWVKNPRKMLIWRAGSALADVVYPDLTRGIAAMEDVDDREPAPVIHLQPASPVTPMRVPAAEHASTGAEISSAARAHVQSSSAVVDAEFSESKPVPAAAAPAVEITDEVVKEWVRTMESATTTAQLESIVRLAKKAGLHSKTTDPKLVGHYLEIKAAYEKHRDRVRGVASTPQPAPATAKPSPGTADGDLGELVGGERQPGEEG